MNQHNYAVFDKTKAVVLVLCFFALLAVTMRAGAQPSRYVDLSRFEAINLLPYVGDGNSLWVFSDNNTTALQVYNSSPSVFVGPTTVIQSTMMRGILRVDHVTARDRATYTGGSMMANDDDYIGVVAYLDNGNLLYCAWKRETQNETHGNAGLARKGVHCKLVKTVCPRCMRRQDYWRSNEAFSDRVTLLRAPSADGTGETGWEFEQDYYFELNFYPGVGADLRIHKGSDSSAPMLYDISVRDPNTPASARLGFYNESQSKMSGREIEILPISGVQFKSRNPVLVVAETADSVDVPVERNYNDGQTLTVWYEVYDVSDPDNPRLARSGELEWVDGDDTDQNIEITGLDDGVSGNDKKYEIRLLDRDGGELIDHVKTLHVIDDDSDEPRPAPFCERTPSS